jgi:membrane fusion protein (multidrug efflux system)
MRIPLLLTAGAMLLMATACGHTNRVSAAPKPLEVLVADVQQRDVPLYREWIGTADGLVNAEIKAQVTGYLVKQEYIEGSFVRQGQMLFQIDPRPFQADLDQAQGRLAQSQGQLAQARAQLTQAEAEVAVAEANQHRVQLDVDRYTPLFREHAITEQDLDNATQNNMAAKAQLQATKAQVETDRAQITAAMAAVESANAAVETARINLGFTRLTAPIDGITGIALLQVGALVNPASGALTTVSTVDPIKVYFTISEQEYLERKREYPTPEKFLEARARLQLELILADGTTFPEKGKVDFANRQVDVRTGAMRVAGIFPNPGNVLRPGEYGRVRAAVDIDHGALLVPQQAVFDLQGTRELAVVGGDNKVSIRAVTLGDTVGHDWIVSEGVKPGERVVAEGVQKVRPGMLVDPKPFHER